MMKYMTMTVRGLYGTQYQADDDADACTQAERDGYNVQEIIPDTTGYNDMLLVVK